MPSATASLLSKVAAGLSALYGLVSLTGGIIGFVKANSLPSLLAGGGAGLLLLGCAFLILRKPMMGLIGSAVIALALLGRRAPEPFRTERWLFLGLTLVAVLLAFGPTMPLPAGLGRIRGPYALLGALPGFTALRAPGRFIHLVLLTGAVLAAGGLATVLAMVPRST